MLQHVGKGAAGQDLQHLDGLGIQLLQMAHIVSGDKDGLDTCGGSSGYGYGAD